MIVKTDISGRLLLVAGTDVGEGDGGDGIDGNGSRDRAGDGIGIITNVEFVAEGAANALFRVNTAGPLPLQDRLEGRLFRLRKGTQGFGVSGTRPPDFVDLTMTVSFLCQVELELGEDNVVSHEVVGLDAGALGAFDNVLRRADANRDDKRRGWFLLDQHEVLILQDMTPSSTEDAILFDFKPKWLAQSPSAPPGAIRCRTCALDIRRQRPIEKRFCPLALGSGKVDSVKASCDVLLPSLTLEWNREKILDELTAYFCGPGHRILNKLRDLQVRNDPDGVVALSKAQTRSSRTVEQIVKAMTFRDCSFLVKITKSKGFQIEAKLADFDIKVLTEEKLSKWIEDEVSLTDLYTRVMPDACYIPQIST
jgi:inositol-pentakisphosphate 2-kinase